MNIRDEVIEIIYVAMRTLNEELAEGKKVAIATDTKLFGPDATLDSLSLVSVIVDVEAGVGDRFGKAVSLTDDEAMSQSTSPFSTVLTLTDYIVSQLSAAGV
jgi:acyl carrier protein